MKETINKITNSILLITILIAIFQIYTIFSTNSEKYKNIYGIGIQSRKIDINILDNRMLCEDIIVFDMNTNKNIDYKFIQDYKYLSNIKIYINNEDDFYFPYLNMGLRQGRIILDELALNSINFTDKTLTIKLRYELGIDYITRYTNTDVLPYFIALTNVDYLKNLTITINSNKMITNLAVNNASINQTQNAYIINIKNLKNSTNIDILFNINTKINNTINSEYINEDPLRELDEIIYINERIPVLIICIIFSIILFILSFFINRKKRIKTCNKETSGLVSPILAEAIVDSKIGLKELLMTTIIELSIRGNIKIINNNMLELVSLNNLELYEKYIVDLLFDNSSIKFNNLGNKCIKFSDINNIFVKSNIETLTFAKKINIIKDLLLEKIFSINIFSKKLSLINKVIKISAILISINLPQIFFKPSSQLIKVFLLINFFVIGYYIKKNINKTSTHVEIINTYHKSQKNMIITIIFILFIIITLLYVYVAKYHFVFFIIILLTYALNLYTIYKSQSIALTRNGRKEQAKLVELKNYINNYSLIKNRDLESVVIWDEYLAYATAFGIPNKVIDSIYEGWYNLNLILQVVEKILN